jgi:hypothetical protein
MGVGPRKLESDLPKRNKTKVVYCLRTLVHRESSMKQYVRPASVDSAAPQLRQSPCALYCDLACSCGVTLIFTTK